MKSFQATLNQTIWIPTTKSKTLEGWLTKCCQLLNNIRASVKIWCRVETWWNRWLWDVLLCTALYLQQAIDHSLSQCDNKLGSNTVCKQVSKQLYKSTYLLHKLWYSHDRSGHITSKMATWRDQNGHNQPPKKLQKRQGSML